MTPMVIGLSLVKNEADVIEPFVRHNLQYLDALFVADNGSVDRTRQILVALQHEGLPLIVFDDPVAAYTQSEKMTRMLRGVSAAVLPDFVLTLDADEFIDCESRHAFLDQLNLIPVRGAGLIRWKTYVLTPGNLDRESSDPPRSLTKRRTLERPQYFKVALRLDGRYQPDIVLIQGNHSALGAGGTLLPQVELSGISFAHVPVRGAAQLASKAVVGWMAYLAKDRNARRSDLAYQWREAFDVVLAKGGVPNDELTLRSMLYAQDPRPVDWDADLVSDPVGFSYLRRYGSGLREPALATVARSWERSACPPTTISEELVVAISDRLRGVEASPVVGDASMAGTAFSPTWHLARPYFDAPPFRYLAELLQPESVLDVGCGMGAALRLFGAFGATRVLGIDGFPGRFTILAPEQYRQHDLAEEVHLGETFDLVSCIEVAEHLVPGSEEVLLGTLARHARQAILFSAAGEGQPGEGHINCRPLADWLGMWRALGWSPDLLASLAFRALSTFSWLRRNPVLLRRSPPYGPHATAPEARLLEIGRMKYNWYSQEPCIYDYPFGEEPPRDLYIPSP
jgi:SAM-dependent methyltransferase